MSGLYNLTTPAGERLITRATWDQTLTTVKQFMRKNGLPTVEMRDAETNQLIKRYNNKHTQETAQ